MIQRTRLHLGPADHGRRLPYDEFMAADYEGGYKYEIIDGELYVSPLPNPEQEWVESEVLFRLNVYAREHPEVINHVSNKARVFVHSRPDATVPEPDLAAYQNYPQRPPPGGRRWETVSPVFVAEVISPSDPNKDLVRNVELYWQVPSIQEYWVFDLRPEAEHPLTGHRRQKR
jgi:Uma2 family endonuclease